MRNLIRILIILVFVGAEEAEVDAAAADWNPIVDECNSVLFGYSCKSIINGRRIPDEWRIEKDVRRLVESTASRITMTELLTTRNYRERRLILKRFNELKGYELKMQFEKCIVNSSNWTPYNQLIWSLSKPISEQYAAYLGYAAHSSNAQMIHSYAQVIVTVLGGLTNKGLRSLREHVFQDSEQPEKSLVEMLRQNKLYSAGFTNLVEQLIKGDRSESPQLIQTEINKDVENLIVSFSKNDVESVICLLTTRSFKHLKKVIPKFNTLQGPRQFTNQIQNHLTDDNLLKSAINTLHSVIMNRPRQFAYILRTTKYYAFKSNMIISRSEIDLGNIKEFYELDYKSSLISDFTEVFGNEGLDRDGLQILRNLLEAEPQDKNKDNNDDFWEIQAAPADYMIE